MAVHHLPVSSVLMVSGIKRQYDKLRLPIVYRHGGSVFLAC